VADHRVKLTLTLFVPRGDLAERLTARAIREGKNIEALVMEILEAKAPMPMMKSDRRLDFLSIRPNGGTPGSAGATAHPSRPGARGQSSNQSSRPGQRTRRIRAWHRCATLLDARPIKMDLTDPSIGALAACFRGHEG
jgi:hypothetical protein